MEASKVTVEKIKFWIMKDWNVMLKGLHGCGKTTMLKQACDELGLEFGKEVLYFSGATLDPYVDFCGIPHKVQDEHGNYYTDFIFPKWMVNNDVKVIIIDEYNRSHKKVRNATMELIQFGSINDKKLTNLKCVLTAVNPSADQGYDTEDMDPAQKDRFWIQAEVPYKPDSEYFTRKFGKHNAEAAIAWWNNLDEDLQFEISPRRLDIAIEVFQGQGDLRDVLPKESPINKLKKNLHTTPAIAQLRTMIHDKKWNKLKEWLKIPENYYDVKKEIVSNPMNYDLYLPYLPDEYLSELFSSNENVRNFVLKEEKDKADFKAMVDSILESNVQEELTNHINMYRSHFAHQSFEVNENVEIAEENIEDFVTVKGFETLKENLSEYKKRDQRDTILKSIPKKISNKIGRKASEDAIKILDSAMVLWGKAVFLDNVDVLLPAVNKLYLTATNGMGDKDIAAFINKYNNLSQLFLVNKGFCIQNKYETAPADAEKKLMK